MGKWEDLSIRDKAGLIKIYVSGGILDLREMKNHYNSFSKGGDKSSYIPSQAIKDYLKKTERFRSEWYDDNGGVKTIGYGFTGSRIQDKYPDGITRQQANEEFEYIINKFAKTLESLTPNFNKLTQNQKDALLSYMYNIGPGRYKNSKELQQALQDEDWQNAAKYINIGYNNKNLPGLRTRRDYEQGLFLSGLDTTLGQSQQPVSIQEEQAQGQPINWYQRYMESIGAAPIPPQVGSMAERPEERVFNSNAPLAKFSLPEVTYGYPSYTPSSSRRDVVESTDNIQDIPTTEEILNDLWSSMDNENLFVGGGDTEDSLIGPPVPASVYANNVRLSIGNRDLRKSFMNDLAATQAGFVAPSSFVTEPVNQIEQEVLEKPVTAKLAESVILNDTRKYIGKQLSEQEVTDIQQELVDAGYDLGRTGKAKNGVDGNFGDKTWAAYKDYFGKQEEERQKKEAEVAEVRRKNRQMDEEASLSNIRTGIMPIMAAPLLFGLSKLSKKDNEELNIKDVSADNYSDNGLALQMSRDIPEISRQVNRLTLYPEHTINQIVGRVASKRGTEAADSVEEAGKKLAKARKIGNKKKIEEAREELIEARKQLIHVPGRRSLTNAEERQALAILTSLNGDKPMTYEDYLKRIKLLGKEPGDYLGTGATDKNKRGKEVALYGGKSSYAFTNEVEKDAGNIEKYDEKHGYKKEIKVVDGKPVEVIVDKNGNELSMRQKIMRTDARIKTDPNRGRLGAWSYRVLENGDIEIIDNFEATEEKDKIAKGKNDDSGYNDSRSFWKRGTTHKLGETISKRKYDKYVTKARKKLNSSDN